MDFDMSSWNKICNVADLEEAKFSIFLVENKSVGVIKINSEVHALLNYCPHAGAELCKGKVRKKTVYNNQTGIEYEKGKAVISCPWHGWEYNIDDGLTDFGFKSKPARLFETQVYNNYVYVKI